MFTNKKKIAFSILFSMLVMLAFSFFVTDFGGDKKVYASTNSVQVSTDGGQTASVMNIESDEFRNLIGSNVNQVIVTFIFDCELNSTLEIYAQTTFVTAGDHVIRRSGDFVLIKNYGNLIIGEDDDDDNVILDGSNYPSTLIENYATGNKKMIVNHLVLCGNGDDAPTHNNPGDQGALYNEGNVFVKNIEIHDFYAKTGSAIFNTKNFYLYNGRIHSNVATVGGTIANLDSGANFTIGDSTKLINQSDLSVKIYDNISYGTGAGILNGTLGSNERMFITDCEMYNNRVHSVQTAFGGAIGNFASLTINYAYIHGNLTMCAVDGSAFSAGAGIYNAGDSTRSASCKIYDAKIENNSSKIFEDNTFANNKQILTPANDKMTIGAGVVNYGSIEIFGGCIKNNDAFQGKDLWIGSESIAQGTEKVLFAPTNKKIELGLLFLNSINCDFDWADVNDSDDLVIDNFDISSAIAGDSAIIDLDNYDQEEVLAILLNSNDLVGFEIDDDKVYIMFLITFKTQIYGTAQFDEKLTVELVEVHLNGREAELEDVFDAEAGDTLTYEWYYYPDMYSPKTVLSTNKQYKIGVGLVGKRIYVTAKLEKESYVCNCLVNAHTDEVVQKVLTATWGSNSPNWNPTNYSFSYSGYNQNPVILNFDTEYANHVTYNIFDSDDQPVSIARFVGNYKVRAVFDIDDVTIEDESFEKEYAITKKVVSIPKIKNTFFILNYQMQTLEFEEIDPTVISVAGEKATSVGDYTATFSLKDKDNYVWENGFSYDYQVRWTISYPVSPIVFVVIGVVIALIVAIVLIRRYKKKRKQMRLRGGVNTKAINDFNNK